MHITNRAIPPGATVVVVGANGYMAVETCDKLLQAGYRVRGTVRDVDRHRDWMHRLFGDDKFELVQVPDFEMEGAFDEAFKGAAGVIYPSMPIIFHTDPAQVFGPMIKGVINTLEAAARAGVQRYVLSSSSKAVHSGAYDGDGEPCELIVDTFNYEAIEKARGYGDDDDDDGSSSDGTANTSTTTTTTTTFERMLTVYSAGRTLAELAFWDWVKTKKPSFMVANCVVPDGQFGRVLDVDNINTGPSSSTGQLKLALEGEWDKIGLQLAFFTDVQDSARLLVMALASASVNSERIFSYYHNRNWNGMREKVRDMFPDRRSELVRGEDGHQEFSKRDASHATRPIARAEELLREAGRPGGFAGEEDIIRDFVASMFGREG